MGPCGALTAAKLERWLPGVHPALLHALTVCSRIAAALAHGDMSKGVHANRDTSLGVLSRRFITALSSCEVHWRTPSDCFGLSSVPVQGKGPFNGCYATQCRAVLIGGWGCCTLPGPQPIALHPQPSWVHNTGIIRRCGHPHFVV